MAVANGVMQSTESTSDDLSPTTIVLQALKKAGVPLTADNIRRYVSAGMRQTNEAGTDLQGDKGDKLRIENPGETADSAARGSVSSGGRSPGVGQSGDASQRVEQSGNPPGADLSHGPTNEASEPSNTTKVSSTPPVSDTGQPVQRVGPDDFASFITPAAIAAAAVGGGAIPGMFNRGAEFVGNAQPSTGRMMDVDPTSIAGPDTKLLGQSDGMLPPPSTLEAAMQQAIAPAQGIAATPPSTTGAPDGADLTGVRPIVANPGGLGRQPLPAGINPYEVGGSASPAPQTIITPENTTGAPRVPLSSTEPRNVPMGKLVAPSWYRNMPAQAMELFNLGRRIP